MSSGNRSGMISVGAGVGVGMVLGGMAMYMARSLFPSGVYEGSHAYVGKETRASTPGVSPAAESGDDASCGGGEVVRDSEGVWEHDVGAGLGLSDAVGGRVGAGAQITFLGQSGFVYEFGSVKMLIDPWFYTAFNESWFPFPNNRHMVGEVLAPSNGVPYTHLYISHLHQDHFDDDILERLDKDIHVVVAAYRSDGIGLEFERRGFTQVTRVPHLAEIALGTSGEVKLQMFLDTSFKEDSAILLTDSTGYRFFDANDCHMVVEDLPKDVDIYSGQFCGAQWYPICYHYSDEEMAKRSHAVREDSKAYGIECVMRTGAHTFVPSGGPPVFLDPVLARFSDPEDIAVAFPFAYAAEDFYKALPHLRIYDMVAGDALIVASGKALVFVEYEGPNPRAIPLSTYTEARRAEWEAIYTRPFQPVTTAELYRYFVQLWESNSVLMLDGASPFEKTFQIQIQDLPERFQPAGEEEAGDKAWVVYIGPEGVRLAESGEGHEYVPEGETASSTPFPPVGYQFKMLETILRDIVDEVYPWEDAFAGLRLGLKRDPDMYDLKFFAWLRYGNRPAQTEYLVEQQKEMARANEMIEHPALPGVRFQRYCPHAGEDLTTAVVCNGVIKCPRHGWKFDANTGECISGGNIPLRMEHLDW